MTKLVVNKNIKSKRKFLQTISFIIVWDFSMFYQIFPSPQVKRSAIFTYKHGIYEFSPKYPVTGCRHDMRYSALHAFTRQIWQARPHPPPSPSHFTIEPLSTPVGEYSRGDDKYQQNGMKQWYLKLPPNKQSNFLTNWIVPYSPHSHLVKTKGFR